MINGTCNIREIENKDYLSVAAVWREVLGALEITDGSFVETCEKMKNDSLTAYLLPSMRAALSDLFQLWKLWR